MSAPKAGPPVTSARRSPGSPSEACGAQRLDCVVECEPGQVGLQRHRRDRGLSVLGDLGRRPRCISRRFARPRCISRRFARPRYISRRFARPRRAGGGRDGEHALARLIRRFEVRRGQRGAVSAADHQNRGNAVAAGKLGAGGVGADRLGPNGHRHRGLLGGVAATDEPHQGAGRNDDDERDEPGESAVHAATISDN